MPKRRGLGASALRSASSTPAAAASALDGRAPRRPDDPFRMAVVGSGPAGFYTAYRIMAKLPSARVDMYESLPVPYGLVRYGVAPDHPEVKNCQEKFEEVAAAPNFTFLGNTTIGDVGTSTDNAVVKLPALLRNYDAVLFSYGAGRDKALGIPGESSLSGIYSAREFVGWYNGLPECAALAPDLTRGDEAVVIGQGNVALDVARMLLQDVDALRQTDMTEEALESISRSRVRRVHVVGRRGPMQAAFTIKEVRELMKLPDVAFHPADESLIPADLKALPRASRRIMEVIAKGSAVGPSSAAKSWSLDFCLSPTEFTPREGSTTEVGKTTFERTELSSKFDSLAQPRLTGELVVLDSPLVFRSIGYKSSPLPGFKEAGVMFDERRGIVMNDGMGRVLRTSPGGDETDITSELFPGLYCAGWVKRGPTGVIAGTMQDAFDTADCIIQDWLSGLQFLGSSASPVMHGWDGVKNDIAGGNAPVVHWSDWQKIDSIEKEKGRTVGKEREKITSATEMLRMLEK